MSKETNDSHESESQEIELAASKWAVKQSIGFSAQEQDEFFEWLAADPEHAEAFSSRRQIWDELNSLAEWRPEHSLKPNPDLLRASVAEKAPKQTLLKVVLFAAGIAAALVIGAFSWKLIGQGTPSSIKLAEGEFARGYERHPLEDGSIVELNRGAQAVVEFTKSMRRVTLDSGEAHFTIAKDPDRPFIVNARGVAVQAVGTIFNVQINQDSVNVLVTEGRVAVDHFANEMENQPLDLETIPTPQLSAGQGSVFDLTSKELQPLVQKVSPVEIEQRLSWLKQVLSFQATPLSDIVHEFNRRNYTQITIEDPSIRDLELTVALKPNNIEGFLELLEVTMGIHAERIADSIIILRKYP